MINQTKLKDIPDLLSVEGHYDTSFAVLDSLSRLSYRNIAIANMATDEIIYLSENCTNSIGVSREEILEEGIESFALHVCEDNVHILNAAREAYRQFFSDEDIEDPSMYTLSFDVRVRSQKTGILNLVHFQLTPITVPNNAAENLFFCMTSLSPHKQSGMIEMMDIRDRAYWQYSTSSKHWYMLPDITLKKEEIEVIKLSAQGLSILEMSHVMNKSFDTIKFYRKVLFKKLKVENITEAVSYAMAKQLI